MCAPGGLGVAVSVVERRLFFWIDANSKGLGHCMSQGVIVVKYACCEHLLKLGMVQVDSLKAIGRVATAQFRSWPSTTAFRQLLATWFI